MPPSSLRDVLEPWCAAGLTGVLRVAHPPGGSIHLLEGRISFAEYPAAAGLEQMLVASGRLPAEDWRAAMHAGAADCRVGEQIVHSGLLTWAELETVVAAAVLDAAYFLFDLATPLEFEPGVRHPLGSPQTWDLDAVRAEVDRRRSLLQDAWPESNVDVSAIVPQRQLRGHCVALTSLQWEIIANADRCRNPMELAQLLGQDTFSVILEARRMVRAGLLEHSRLIASPGGPRADPPSASESDDRATVVSLDPAAPLPRRRLSKVDRPRAAVPEDILSRVLYGIQAA
jgi:hypothetical protein